MSSINGTRTEQHLVTAFLNESADQNRYFFFSKIAKKEGYIELATAFEETALQERSHAKNFLKHLGPFEGSVDEVFKMGPLGTNIENLRQAVANEREQHEVRYPNFAAVARDEGFGAVAVLFSAIAKAEHYHEQRFRRFISSIEGESVFKSDAPVTWVCAKCGYIHQGTEALPKCPACGHPRAYFQRTDVL
jgi:rubrerythrin